MAQVLHEGAIKLSDVQNNLIFKNNFLSNTCFQNKYQTNVFFLLDHDVCFEQVCTNTKDTPLNDIT